MVVGTIELIFTIPPDSTLLPGVRLTRSGSLSRKKSLRSDGEPLEKRGYQHRWE